jgi:hypothetical protein
MQAGGARSGWFPVDAPPTPQTPVAGRRGPGGYRAPIRYPGEPGRRPEAVRARTGASLCSLPPACPGGTGRNGRRNATRYRRCVPPSELRLREVPRVADTRRAATSGREPANDRHRPPETRDIRPEYLARIPFAGRPLKARVGLLLLPSQVATLNSRGRQCRNKARRMTLYRHARIPASNP